MPHDRKSPRTRLLVNASLGLGKTSAALAIVAEIKEKITVVLLVPSLEKAEEAATDYNKIRQETSLPALVFRGRGANHPTVKDEKTCRRHKAAEAVAKAGLGVEAKLCTICHIYDTCAYQNQITNLRYGEGKLIIATHDHLFLNAIPTNVDLLIIDESVTLKAACQQRFNLDRIFDCLPAQAVGSTAIKTRETLQAVYSAFISKSEGQTLSLLRIKVSRREIIAARRFLEKNPVMLLMPFDGGMNDAQIIQSLSSVESPVVSVIALLRQIEREWRSGRGDFNSIVMRDFEPGSRQLTVHALKQPLLARSAPTLLLDGTASITLNKKLFGDSLESCEFRVERNADVLQTSGKGFSRGSMTGKKKDGSALTATSLDEAKKLRRRIVTYIHSLPHRSLLMLTNKASKEAVQPDLADHVATAHFNAVRGLNLYEHCEAALCIGREQPPAEAIEDIARAYAATDAEPFFSILNTSGEPNGGYVLATRGIRRPGGKVSPVAVVIHPHPIAQEVMEQIREAEIVQAVDRIRPIHNRRSIYLFNNIAADITVSKVIPWKTLTSGLSRFAQAAMRGSAVPCSAAEMSRIHPDLWPTPKIAEHDLQRTPRSQIESLFGEWVFIAVEYKIRMQKGKYFAAWANRDDPRGALEQVVGKVEAFRPVEA